MNNLDLITNAVTEVAAERPVAVLLFEFWHALDRGYGPSEPSQMRALTREQEAALVVQGNRILQTPASRIQIMQAIDTLAAQSKWPGTHVIPDQAAYLERMAVTVERMRHPAPVIYAAVDRLALKEEWMPDSAALLAECKLVRQAMQGAIWYLESEPTDRLRTRHALTCLGATHTAAYLSLKAVAQSRARDRAVADAEAVLKVYFDDNLAEPPGQVLKQCAGLLADITLREFATILLDDDKRQYLTIARRFRDPVERAEAVADIAYYSGERLRDNMVRLEKMQG